MMLDFPEPQRSAPPPVSLGDAYLLSLWMRGFYSRYAGLPSVERALLQPIDFQQGTEDDGSERRYARLPLPPARVLAAHLLTSCEPRRQMSCCIAGVCRSTMTNDFMGMLSCVPTINSGSSSGSGGGEPVVGIAAVRGVSHATALAVRRRMCFHSACLHHGSDGSIGSQIRMLSQARGEHTRDDTLMCLASHAPILSSPCSLLISDYAMNASASAVYGVAPYAGLDTVLLSPTMPRWSSVTLYRVNGGEETSNHICNTLIISIADAERHGRYEQWKKLRLGSMAISPMSLCRLMQSVVSTGFLTELCLEQCGLQEHHVRYIGEVLRDASSSSLLRRLCLRANPLLALCAGAVGEAFGMGPQSLAVLDVALCELNDVQCVALLRGIASNRIRLPGHKSADLTEFHFDFSCNVLTNAWFVALDEAAVTATSPQTSTSPPAESGRIVIGLETLLKSIVSLDISGNLFQQQSTSTSDRGGGGGGGAAVGILNILFKRCTMLCRLRVRDTNLTCEGSMSEDSSSAPGSRGKAVIKAIKKRGSTSCPTSTSSSPSTLMKRICKMWSSSVNQACGGMMVRGSELCGSGQERSRVPWIGLAQVARDSATDEVVPNDIELNFGGCHLTSAEVKAVLHALHDAAAVDASTPPRGKPGSCFYLRGAAGLYATDSVAQALSDHGVHLTHLVELDLRTCRLGNDGILALAAALERSSNGRQEGVALEALYLSDNGIEASSTSNSAGSGGVGSTSQRHHSTSSTSGRHCMPFLAKALRACHCPRLRILDLSFNDLVSFRSLTTLVEQASLSMRYLNLSGNVAIRGAVTTFASTAHHRHLDVETLPASNSASGSCRPPVLDIIEAMKRRLSASNGGGGNASFAEAGDDAAVVATAILILRDCDCEDDDFILNHQTHQLRIVT